MSAATAERAPAAEAVSVSFLVRQLAEVEDAYSAHRARLEQEHKAGLMLSGRVGALKAQLRELIAPGESVTVRVSSAEALTVSMPQHGAPTCTRSRIVR